MSLFNELKRRNVFRIGIAYGITTWLIAQVAGLAAVSFFAPDWVMKMIITLLILGFPIALLMAWAYELTPDGLRREADIEPGQSVAQTNASKLDRTITIVLIMAVLYFGYDKFVLDPQRDQVLLESATQQARELIPAAVEIEQAQADETPSIAVLAFANMSDDAGNEYFSEGLSEELLNLLVKIPQLQVAARTSSFSYKGKDTKIAQIGAELNVAHVLEGSVRKSGNRVRITAQLIKADDGFHLWSETFDRELNDIFVVQDEIAAAVVDALRVTLLGALPTQRLTNPEAYSLYLQGNYLLNLSGKDNIQKAMEALQQALVIDPEYAPAWSSLHLSYSLLIGYRVLSREEGVKLAMAALDKALEIDDKLASAWAGVAYMKRSFFWDWEGARAASEKALRLEPNNVRAIGTAASIASTFGQLDKAIELFERNVELDPLRLSSLYALANRYRAVGRFDEALTTYNKLLALNPEYPGMREKIAIAYLHMDRPEKALTEIIGLPDSDRSWHLRAAALFDLGRFEEAQAIVDEFLESPSEIGPLRIAVLYAWRGENDDAFEWLDVALEKRDPSLSFILWNGALTRLSNDPRYPVFLEKMGLREAWEAMPPEYGGPSKH